MFINTYGIVDDAVWWCVGLPGLSISFLAISGVFDPGRGCASPSGLKPYAPSALR
jgi:hypothetical protein